MDSRNHKMHQNQCFDPNPSLFHNINELLWAQNWYKSHFRSRLGFLSGVKMICHKTTVRRENAAWCSLCRDPHLERSPISNSAVCDNGPVINSKSFQCSLNKETMFQGRRVSGEITRPAIGGAAAEANLCAHINWLQAPAEINLQTTLIPSTYRD